MFKKLSKANMSSILYCPCFFIYLIQSFLCLYLNFLFIIEPWVDVFIWLAGYFLLFWDSTIPSS